jgi:hypothetical protein
MRSAATAVPPPPRPVPRSYCTYSLLSLQFVHFPAKITGDDAVTIHVQAAIDNAKEEEGLPLAPWL